MARLISVDDEDWPEVGNINSYAIFMGYLLMGVRGLGLLVLTWTTVVLLGGFVSMLQKKDFWCLTVITLVQTAGVFDFLLKEKASDIGNYLKGMATAEAALVFRPFKKDKGMSDSSKIKEDKYPSTARIELATALLVVQLLVLAPVLCLIAVLYVLGLFISAGISLWRLIEHDYGSNAEGGANLKPALNVLYSLAVAQGVVFSYKTIYDYVAKSGIVEPVASLYSMDTALVKDYLDETVTGCLKDTSFARGRNLVTYAVDMLMGSKSRDDYLYGVRVLGTMLKSTYMRAAAHPVLIEQLLTGSASFSHVIQRLVETFGPRSPYSGEIREHAAMIVANVAGSIRLEEQFPGGMMIQCVSSLLDTFEEYSWRPEGYERHRGLPKEYERVWLLEGKEISYLLKNPFLRAKKEKRARDSGNPLHGYKGLVVQGLRILEKLAANEDNCRVIRNTEGLLPKTIVSLTTDQLHRHRDGSHDEQSSIAAVESVELMKRLMATAPGETETKLPSEVSGNSKVIIGALQGILECHRCVVLLKRQAAEVLLDLSVDTPSVISGGISRSRIFVWTLLHIFLLPDYCFDKMCGSPRLAKKSSYIKRLAGEKLLVVQSFMNEASAASTLHSVAAVLADLTRTSVDAAVNITCRLHVVQILLDLCKFYTKDDEFFKELKKAMADVIPKVLKEILVGSASTSAEIHAKTEANNDQVPARRTDTEEGIVPQGNSQEDAYSSQQQNGEEQQEGIRLQEALISLCRAISIWWWDLDEFDDLAEKTCLEQGISKPGKGLRPLVLYAKHRLEEEEAQGRRLNEAASSSSKT